MNLYQKLVEGDAKVSLIGLGYVGMPIAVAFAKKVPVIGYDLNTEKINQYINGEDPTKEVGDKAIQETTVEFTDDAARLSEASFHIVAVPTPITEDKVPNLKPVISASKTLGKHLTKGSIVVYESTVYPGVTEDICIPILEEESGLKLGEDFNVGYSPERINPGDKVHTLENIVKVVSANNEETLDIVAKVYELVVDAGVYHAESIRVAEAAKVIENSQRDINIAFMNELSIIFNKMGIDTQAVLNAAGTKWNFLNFSPGLVGGHCIGVDPYYLTYKAEQEGYHSQIILAGRRINDDMGKYVVENTIKQLIQANIPIQDAKVGILGFTFKENTPDTRNTRIIDIVDELAEYNITPMIADPVADAKEAEEEYGLTFHSVNDLTDLDALIIAVNHDEFIELQGKTLDLFFKDTANEHKVIIDVKGILDRQAMEQANYNYWRL
ncbi:nucleotide sugar dehydrogenase [Aerococcaceae bacterium DSM 111020]|nr:nucleotide sugar dehydrogenase [Aerococcaceae bacterium DSM 111020]